MLPNRFILAGEGKQLYVRTRFVGGGVEIKNAKVELMLAIIHALLDDQHVQMIFFSS